MHCWPEMARSARILQFWLICTYKEGWSSNHISILQWSHIYIKGYTTVYIPCLKFRKISRIEIMCLKGFQNLTSGDFKWPLTSMENNRDHLRTKGYQHTKFEVQATFTRYHVYKVFSLFTLVTSNDLWPPWKTIGIIYPPRAINRPSLKFQLISLIEITCLQGFQTLTSGDLKWPLTAMENNRDHLRTKGYQHVKFEVQATFTCWDTVFTRFPVFDLWWPLTSMENNRNHLRTKGYQHTKFEVQATFTYWDTMFTRFSVF